jgi:hypothetical protein
MAISLYDLSVANYLQTLEGVVGFLEKGLAHFTTNGIDVGEIVETRLFPTCCRSASSCNPSRIIPWARSKA